MKGNKIKTTIAKEEKTKNAAEQESFVKKWMLTQSLTYYFNFTSPCSGSIRLSYSNSLDSSDDATVSLRNEQTHMTDIVIGSRTSLRPVMFLDGFLLVGHLVGRSVKIS